MVGMISACEIIKAIKITHNMYTYKMIVWLLIVKFLNFGKLQKLCNFEKKIDFSSFLIKILKFNCL